MTVPEITLFDSLTYSIDNVTQDVQQAQSELATGKRVNQPSDDPAAYAQEGLITANESAIANDLTLAGRVQARLSGADGALAQVQNALNSAIAIATQGADGGVSTTQMQSLAQSAQGMLAQVVNAANYKQFGSFVFAGTNTLTSAFSSAGAYQGNTGTNTVTFSDGTSVQESFDGQAIFGNATSGAIGTLTSLVSALGAGNKTAVSAALSGLQSAIQQIATVRGTIGSGLVSLRNLVTNSNSRTTDLKSAESNIVGVDVAAEAVKVQQVLLQQGALVSLASIMAKIPLVNVLA